MSFIEWLGFCKHKWKILKKSDVYVADIYGLYENLPTYTRLILKCTKCGKLKTYNAR